VIGDTKQHIAKLRKLAGIGVKQFNIYLMSGDEEEILETYGREIIPALRMWRPRSLPSLVLTRGATAPFYL